MRLETPQWYELDNYWKEIEPFVQRALEHGRMAINLEDVREGILLRKYKVWLARDEEKIHGFAITTVEEFPRRKSLTILIIGGEVFESWSFFIADIEREAEGLGCDEVCALGRLGWTKKAAPHGYKPYSVVYRKVLDK